VEKRSHVAM